MSDTSLTLVLIPAANPVNTGVNIGRSLNYKSSDRLNTGDLKSKAMALTTQDPGQWRWPRGAGMAGKRQAKRQSDQQTPLYPLCRGAARVYIPTLLATRHFSAQTFGLVDSSAPMLTVAEGFDEIFRTDSKKAHKQV